MSAEQALLFPIDGVRIRPTIAMRRGRSYITQCGWCGLVAMVTSSASSAAPSKLGACPSCGHGEWWFQGRSVGAFVLEGDE